MVAQEAERHCGRLNFNHRIHRRRRERSASLIVEAELRQLGSNITQRALVIVAHIVELKKRLLFSATAIEGPIASLLANRVGPCRR